MNLLFAMHSADPLDCMGLSTMPTGQHGFTRVDEEARPSAWVECLDKLRGEPFYREYKDRIRAILAPQTTGLYLEVGAGVGTDARLLGANVIAVGGRGRDRTFKRDFLRRR